MFIDAYNFMMDNEDSVRQYKTVPDAPEGSHAISGINSAAYPSQFAAINALPQNQRATAVQQFYQSQFWNKWFDELQSVELQKRVFDAAVNMGSGTAVKLLQSAINEIQPNAVTEDGHWGPITVAHANDSAGVLTEFKYARVQHYKNIVAENPADAQYLPEWIARAEK